MASSGVAPPSGAAAAVGNAALHGAQRGAAIAQKGVVNLTIYVQRRWLDYDLWKSLRGSQDHRFQY